jgi:type II secretory pathway pseudopilin PulG
MVVIGIIALLVGILLPAVNAARRAARVTASKATLTTISTGLEQFKADARIGGMYPPSGPDDYSNAIVNPQPVLANDQRSRDPLSLTGANLLVWALAGADLLGTPGFRDLNNNGTWQDDTGSDANEPALNLYALDNNGRPYHARSSAYVEIGKMKFPELVLKQPGKQDGYYMPVNEVQSLMSSCFLDNFGQPIVYMRAHKNAPAMFWPNVANPNNSLPGVFHLLDNAHITGLENSRDGIDLGAGPHPSNGLLHPMATPGNPLPDDPTDLLRGSFAYSIWNPKVTAAARPYNEDSYILMSAGPDGWFGTGDDIANFPINQ